MSSTRTVQELNQELATRINREALANPGSLYAGKFVGIAHGQVVCVADTLDELDQALDALGLDPAETFGIEAGHDYSQGEEIWELA